MTGVGIKVSVDDAVVRRALDGLQARGEDLTPAMDEIGAALVSSVLDRFERGADPDGTPWTPLRRALEQGGQTLIDSGRLRGSITHVAASDRVTVGTNVIYAAIHQFGGRAGRGHRTVLPSRPFLGLSEGDIDEVRAILIDHVRGP